MCSRRRCWGLEDHVNEVFAAAGATPEIARETCELHFASEQEALDDYLTNFGPFVTARAVVEPQGRWPEFQEALADLIHRFAVADDGGIAIPSEYFLITIRP